MAFTLRTQITRSAVPSSRPAVAPRTSVRANYRITLRTPDAEDITFDCAPDQLILDAAEAAGADMPFLCRTGTCCGCAGKRIEGQLVQPDKGLIEPEFESKYALLCQSYPRSDLLIFSHAEQDYYNESQFAAAAAAKTSSR